MNREDVIRLAGEAGFGANQRNTLLVKIERFANLVIEECAKICDARANSGDHYIDGMTEAEGCAEAIRERKSK